ncbi:MAG TPA: TonB family protein [Terriglobia bacterium]|nr:TonB family protein [Terriglobia bacterium]
MTDRWSRTFGRANRWALPVCCAAAAVLAAQTTSRAPGTVVLTSKEASRLLIDEVKPEYPALAKVNYIQGLVRLQLRVTPEGHVSTVHIVRGHPFLAEAALQAVRHWIYRPFKNGAEAVGFTTFVDVRFSLHPHSLEQLPPAPERDLDREVKPPALLAEMPEDTPPGSVHMRVLVGDKGRVLDSQPLSGPASGFEAAREKVEHWTFRPARWGNHAVPWYMEIDVPVRGRPAVEGSSDTVLDH